MTNDPLKDGTAKILAQYPDATNIEMKGRHRLYFSFMNEDKPGMYQPKNDIHDTDYMIWPTPKMGPFPTTISSEIINFVVSAKK